MTISVIFLENKFKIFNNIEMVRTSTDCWVHAADQVQVYYWGLTWGGKMISKEEQNVPLPLLEKLMKSVTHQIVRLMLSSKIIFNTIEIFQNSTILPIYQILIPSVIPYSVKFWRGNFDGYWLFKYLMENILTDGYCLSPYTCKCYIVFK